MKIEWTKVTWYSKILAIVIYVGIFFLAFYLGAKWGEANAILSLNPIENQKSNVITNANFICDNDKSINALFFGQKVELSLSDGRNMMLIQTISASGARYANNDESFIFWNKGDTAFIQEGDETTYDNCLVEQ
ncbi:MAG: MliC family protein [Candidatus Pacebacteria bacterium]|nr:MliC family protein [Candidatus Paceibacterota bacterium]